MMKVVARANKARFSFGYINGVDFSSFVSKYGITDMPNFFVYDGEDGSYMDSTSVTQLHTADKLTQYLNDVTAGKIAVHSSGLDQIANFLKVCVQLVGTNITVEKCRLCSRWCECFYGYIDFVLFSWKLT
jgi:hypothetical protein